MDELKQKNIWKSEESFNRQNIEKRGVLIARKISSRPSIEELRERRIIHFNDYVEILEAEDYDRTNEQPWNYLTPEDREEIRKELNNFKATEMAVHIESQIHTRFYS